MHSGTFPPPYPALVLFIALSSPDMLGIHWVSVSTHPRPSPQSRDVLHYGARSPSVHWELRKCALINH